jgi:hypothetical protein
VDFKKTLELILKDFSQNKIRYSLIGGFALGLFGISRTTVDLDFLVHKDDVDKIDKIMKDYQYECVYSTENVSQYVSPVKIFGEIDFIFAKGKISIGIIDRAVSMSIFDGKMIIKVARPEDIIGLKIQALVNNPKRELNEYLDIELLINHFKKDFDWKLIEEYFKIFKLEKKYKEIRKKYEV